MCRQSAPIGLRLAIFILIVACLKTSSSQFLHISATQAYLLCKKPNSHLCVTWRLEYVDSDILKNSSNVAQYCGLSDLKRMVPQRKYITVISLARDVKSKGIFCKGFTTLKGDVVDWKQVEKALDALSRTRRQTAFPPRGRYRGQTQSQYLAIDRGNGKDEGKAEAHSAADTSRASVSGNSGMGQAQSQSIYDPNCRDCYGKSDSGVESLKRAPSVPGSDGNGYVPKSSYGPTVNYRPGQGNTNGIKQPGVPVDVSRPGAGYGPGGNGALVPGHTPGSSTSENGGYGPNGQLGGTGGYGPVQGSEPGSAYGPSLGTIAGDNQRGNNYGQGSGPISAGYGPSLGTTPGGSQGGNMGYGPGQISGPGSGYGPSSGTSPGGSQAGNGYGPSQGSGPSSGYGPTSGSTPAGNQGVGYGPGQGSGSGSGYGPSVGTIPGGSQGGNIGYGPGQLRGPDSGYGPSSGTSPGDNQVGSGYGPGQGSGPSSGYGPTSGTSPTGSQGVGYGPGQGSGLGSAGYRPSLETTPGAGQSGNGGYRPEGHLGGTGGYGARHGNSPGTSGYGLSSGTIPINSQGGNGGYGPSQRNGQNTEYVPQLSGQGVTPGGNQGASPGLNRTPGGSIYNQGQSGQTGPINGSPYGSPQPYIPGQSNLPGGSYDLIQKPIGIGYPTREGALPNTGYGPVQGHGQTNSVGQSTGGSNWPLAQGPYPGPSGSSVYCCVVPNIYGQNIGTGGNISPTTGTLYPPYGTEQTRPGVTGAGSEIQSPYGTKPSSIPRNLLGTVYRPDNIGTSNLQEPQGPNNLQVPETYLSREPYGISNINGPSGLYGRDMGVGPGTYGTGSSEGPGGQNRIQQPGSYIAGTTGGPNGQNGMQGPGPYGTGIYRDPKLQHELRQPDISRGLESQNGMQRPGDFSTDTRITGQNGMPGLGNVGTGTTGGLGNQNGIQGPGLLSTGPNSSKGNHNGMQIPGSYGSGIPGTGINGGLGVQNSNQGSRMYGAGMPGALGSQNSLQGTGTFDTPGRPGDQNVMQRPGVYGTDTTGVSDSHTGLPGNLPATYNGQNLHNNQGNGANIGTLGGPVTYSGQNGNTIPGSGPIEGYPGGIQFPPNSQDTGADNTGFYNQQLPGSLNSPNSQQDFNSQGNPLQGYEYNDGDDSEAEAIVNQATNGTTASASSKGGNNKERAQTHVHGTYTGGGSFQAQAQITGENKEAESQVSGGKKGASSSATGSGRNNKSQANVQLGSETGSIQTQSQSNGAIHSSNSQVQGSVKGGMADAQAKGPGSTSSQAQIGFTPYKDGDKIHEDLQTPFVGGGIASAQSSGRTGQSQSQLHGTFKYGITYNGAAQAGASLDKDAIFPNRLNFEKIDVFDESQKNIDVNSEIPQTEIPSTESSPLAEVPFETKKNTSTEDEVTTEKADDESMKDSESRYLSHTHLDHHKPDTTLAPSPTAVGSRRSFQSGYDNVGTGYDYVIEKDENQPEEYDDTDPGYGIEGNDPADVEQSKGEEFPNYDEYGRDYQTHQSLQSPHKKGIEVQQTTGGNTQHIVLGSLNNHDAEIIQKNSEKPDESKVYQPGERVPGTGGYRIPIGFTGSIKSVASKENTYVVGAKHSPSQAQTVTLTPGHGKVNYKYPSSYGKYISPKDLRSLQSENPKDDRYVSVSKSVTRALDGENNIRKQYSHTYYTKSSSCGYFTFTCTMVSGVDGRKKVCKPKIPTNPDGTPIRC